MKKTFYQQHPGMLGAFCIIVVFIIMGAYLIIEGLDDRDLSKDNLLEIILGVIVITFMIYSFISGLLYRVKFLEESINIIGYRGSKVDKIQFDDIILYSEIIDIKIILTEKNSKKKSVDTLYPSAPKLFFEFLLNNGKTKWLFVTPFSKKQRKEMLEIINSKTGKNFSYDDLEKEDLSIYNIKKSKKYK